MNIADVDTPLTLADGTQIDPVSGKVVRGSEPKFVEVPTTTKIKEEYAVIRRRLDDLPLPVNKMNGVSIILVYKLIGLSDHDIAVATGVPTQQLSNIMMSDAFSELQSMVIENLYAADKEEIRSAMKVNASLGVQRMTQLINSDDEGIALAASKDALDRDGHRPTDVVEHRHKLEGGLTIEVIKRDRTTDIPDIDAQFVSVDD